MSLLGLRLQMLWLRIPVIGGMARLSGQPGMATNCDGSWSNAEIQDLPELEKGEVTARLRCQAAAHPDETARRAAARRELERIF